MKVFAVLALFAAPAFSASVRYDPVYDNPNGSMSSVACSNGPNGLITRGYNKFGQLPKFPYIGGAEAVTGWNSPNCGTCWELKFTNAQGGVKTINVLAIDFTVSGFNIAQRAMDDLTGGHAVDFGVVTVASRKVAASVCGL